MDSNFYQIKFKKKKTNWYELEGHFLKNEKIRVCDCFIDLTITFLREIRDVKCVDSTQCVDEFQERFDKITLNIDLPSNRIYSLFGKLCVICFGLALYQCDYLDFVSEELLFADCQCDMMLVDDTLGNCLYYSEYDLSNMERFCFACLINFLKMVSAQCINFKNDA